MISGINVTSRRDAALTAHGQVSEKEEFFQDHFPGFPVLPGVLILELFRKTASAFWNDSAEFVIREVSQVKFSKYLRPGDHWESVLELVSGTMADSKWKAKLFLSGSTACAAQFRLVQKD